MSNPNVDPPAGHSGRGATSLAQRRMIVIASVVVAIAIIWFAIVPLMHRAYQAGYQSTHPAAP